MNEEEKERLIKKDIASIENRVRHAFNQGYEMGLKERKNTCEDAISRQAVLEVIRKCHCEEWIKADIAAPIEALSPVNPQVKTGHWIPVSERLPDKDNYNHGSVWEHSVLVTAYFKWDDTKHTFIGMRLAEDVINNNFIDECIIAWMPLPEPYKAESEAKE